MDINIEKNGNVTIIELNGDLNANSTAKIQDQVLSQTPPNSKVLLDMTNVKYMSSAGLRFLLLLSRQLGSQIGNIVLIGLREEVQDVMSMTGFLDFFVTAKDRTEGMKTLT
ncbi:MAG: STAS domain-containing protein [Anaerolineae bacterium]|nr:STAS domain-containing protein [Anaerolineae bacterium]